MFNVLTIVLRVFPHLLLTALLANKVANFIFITMLVKVVVLMGMKLIQTLMSAYKCNALTIALLVSINLQLAHRATLTAIYLVYMNLNVLQLVTQNAKHAQHLKLLALHAMPK